MIQEESSLDNLKFIKVKVLTVLNSYFPLQRRSPRKGHKKCSQNKPKDHACGTHLCQTGCSNASKAHDYTDVGKG
jgi:hypothetical protein